MLKKLLKMKFLGIATFILLQSSSYSLQVENYVFDKQISYGGTGYHELTLKNDSSSRGRYKVTLSAQEEKDKFDFEVYPKVVLLEPYSSKKVKILIKQKQDVVEKEYDFDITVNQIQVPTRSIEKLEKDAVGVDGNIGLGLTLPVKGYVGNLGEFKKDVKFDNFSKSSDGKSASFDLVNAMRRSAKIIVKVSGGTVDKSKLFYYLERAEKEKTTSYKVETDFDIKNIKIYDGVNREIIFEKNI